MGAGRWKLLFVVKEFSDFTKELFRKKQALCLLNLYKPSAPSSHLNYLD
jgi:hypothetical protein